MPHSDHMDYNWPTHPQFHTNRSVDYEIDRAPANLERLFYYLVLGSALGLALSLAAGIAFWWLR